MSLPLLLVRVAEQAPESTDLRVIILGVIATVIVAVIGAVGAVAAAWAQGAATRRQATAANEKAEKAQDLAATVADSVGPKNGHGTVQDATGAILARLDGIESTVHTLVTSVDSVVTAADGVNARLKGHDREIASLRHAGEES